MVDLYGLSACITAGGAVFIGILNYLQNRRITGEVETNGGVDEDGHGSLKDLVVSHGNHLNRQDERIEQIWNLVQKHGTVISKIDATRFDAIVANQETVMAVLKNKCCPLHEVSEQESKGQQL